MGDELTNKLETDETSDGDIGTQPSTEVPEQSLSKEAAPAKANIGEQPKKTDEELSKIKFDVADLDDDATSAPSEKGDFEGVFRKLPKLDVLKKEEDDKKISEKDVIDESIEAATTQTTDKVASGDKRNYEQFPEALRGEFKHFNNKAFAWAEKTYPKLVQAEKALAETNAKLSNAEKGIQKIPDSYHEHPQAFILDPEFRKIEANYEKAAFEADFWIQQLEKIESGETFQKLLGYRQGQPVYSEPQKPTARDKVEIGSFLNSALNYQREFQTQAKVLQGSFSRIHEEAISKVRDTMNKFIPWKQDEKLLDEKISSGNGKSAKTVKETLDVYLSFVPPQFRGHVMSEAWANLMVVNLLQGNRLSELEKITKTVQTNAQHQEDAQPTGSKAGGSGNKKSLAVVNTEGMDD